MKKVIALLSGLMMLSTCAVGIMPVQAEHINHWVDNTFSYNADNFLELDSGEAGIRLHESLDGFVVITDAGGLDTSLFNGCDIYEVTGISDWGEHLPASMQANDNRYYVVDSSPTIYRDESYSIQIPYSNDVIRHIMVEAENIRDIVNVSREMDGIAQWGGDFGGALETGYPDDWMVDGSTLLGYAGALEELNGTAYESDYVLLCAAFDKAEELEVNNPDKCAFVYPTITITGITETAEYSYVDIWENVGNVDGINGVDATDAAEILIAAASYGAYGKYDKFDLYNKKATADVNADGTIDASDALTILQYVAAIGAGKMDVKIRDFIY